MNEDKTTKHTDENTTDIVTEQVEQCALSDDACVQAADDLGIIDTTDSGPDERYAPFNERDNTKPERGTRVWSNVFFVVVIVLSLYFMYDLSSQIADGNSKSFADVIANLNPWYLALSVGVLLVMMALGLLEVLRNFENRHPRQNNLRVGTESVACGQVLRQHYAV